MKRSLLLGGVLPAALVLAVAGGGAVYVSHTVNTADVTAPTLVWPKRTMSVDPEHGPDPVDGSGKGRTDSALARQLLPVPDGYTLGPDIDGLGNDRVLSPAESVAFLKGYGNAEFGSDVLPAEAASKIKGLAVRSYASTLESLVIEVRMIEVADGARPLPSSLPDDFGVPGHPDAKCFTEPKDPDHPDALAEAGCVAIDGDIAVTVVAYGAAPLHRSELTDVTEKQLTRLVSAGGKSV